VASHACIASHPGHILHKRACGKPVHLISKALLLLITVVASGGPAAQQEGTASTLWLARTRCTTTHVQALTTSVCVERRVSAAWP
jgi:hypothetical protein